MPVGLRPASETVRMSSLFETISTLLSMNCLNKSWSDPARGFDPSTTIRTTSATAAAWLERRTPSDSTMSMTSDVPRKPAVSTRVTFRPSRSIVSVTRSRVVPGMSVTMARDAPASALNKLDFPTFGRPTIAICKPSRTSRPRRAPVRSVRVRRTIASMASASEAGSTK